MGSMRGMNTVLLAPQPDKNSAFTIFLCKETTLSLVPLQSFGGVPKKHNRNAGFKFYEMRWNSTCGMRI